MSEKKYIRKSLSTATGLLLGGAAIPAAHAFGTDTPWELNAAVLYYGEGDGRVQALEPVIMGRKELDDEEYLNLKLVVDALTGATPTGAVPSSQPQTFTRPSGNGSYTVAAGEVPLDDTFHDTRTAINADWEKPLSEMTRVTFGANVSSEFDFQSLGLSATIDHDLNQRNTTLTTGIALETDTLNPEGGIPTELASIVTTGPGDDDGPESEDEDDLQSRNDSENRKQVDLLLGLTQVISERTLMQFNISHSESDGYHNDPFKFFSIVEASPGLNQGDPIDNRYEKRPDSRSKTSFFWKTLHSLPNEDVIDFSYRYLTDDWGIKSHTLDFRYTWMLDSGSYWQPHLRFYKQEAADFYRTLLPSSEAIPEFISADYRLGDLESTTIGIKYSQMLANENLIEFRLELLSQTNDPSPGSAIGNQAGQQLILDTKASILQFTYSF